MPVKTLSRIEPTFTSGALAMPKTQAVPASGSVGRLDQKLSDALMEIGKCDAARAAMIEGIKAAEAALDIPGVNVRDEITGPVIDALHRSRDVMSVRLANGLRYSFHYRGKIAREIVMSASSPLDHLWEPQLTKLVVWLSHTASHHVLIGGAYAGDHAILMANEIKPLGGMCHCFEPNEENAAMLARNAQDNRLANIVVNRCGLWETDGARLVLVGDDSHAHAVPAAKGQEKDSFPTMSIAGYGARAGIDRLDLILLDIEGGEFAALKGAERYLAQPMGIAPNIVFEVHRSYVDWSSGLDRTEIVQFLAHHGYFVYAVRDYTANVPMAGKPIELIDLKDAYLEGPPHGFNLLAVKDARVVQDPIFRFRKGVSPKLLFHRDPRFHAPIED